MPAFGSSSILVATTSIVLGVTVIGWRIAQRIRFARDYWTTCLSETVCTTHQGVSWLQQLQDKKDDGGAGRVVRATWFRVNDVIMGGKSTSSLSVNEDGNLVFSGNLSRDGGGFVSVRTNEDCPIEVPPNANAVRVKLSGGNGQLWKVTLGTSHSLWSSDPTWSHDVWTSTDDDDKKDCHRLMLADFTATRRGQPVPGTVLEPSEIRYVGLILSLYTQTGTPNPRLVDGPFEIVLRELEFDTE